MLHSFGSATLLKSALAGTRGARSKTKNTAGVKSCGVFRFAFFLILSSCITAKNHASTAPDTRVENTASVQYQFKGRQFQTSDNDVFVTAKITGSPAVITLMHHSIDFAGQLQAAQQGTPPTGNALNTSNTSSGTRSSAPQSRLLQGRTAASSDGISITGSFPVEQGQCATSSDSSSLTPQPSPMDYQGKMLNVPNTLSLTTDEFFKVGDTIFIYLNDQDQNLEATLAEKIVVTIISEDGIDKETIELTETETNSGFFTGYVQSVDINLAQAQHFDCKLSVTSESNMQARYQDQFDAVDIAAAGALFDPSSYIIDADTGEYINDIVVRLIDSNTGELADVLSPDGGYFDQEDMPFITGGSITDNLGNTYTFPYGGFSFPVLGSGQYKIQIGDSVYHDYPISAQKTLTEINSLPNGPFNLDEQGSRALAFDVPGITFRMDIPLNPKDNSVLLTKTANKSQAAVGELVLYNIHLQNSEIPGIDVNIQDQLPLGFRYVPGSAALDGDQIADPIVTDSGKRLTFNFANIIEKEGFNLRYVARIGVNAQIGQATNTVWLEDDNSDGLGKLESNTSKAHIEIKEELFSEKSRIFGRVYIGDCDNNSEQEGIGGVRIYLENGNYIVTDEDGLWHMESQEPGTHIVQLDTTTLPKYLDLMTCDNYGTHAGREYSQFVDVEPGTMWRADFVVKLKPPSVGEVIQRLSSRVIPLTNQELLVQDTENVNSPVKQKISYRLRLTGTEVVLKDLRSLIMLPEGVIYKKNSALFDGKPVAAPKEYDSQTLLFSLNDPGKDWQHILEFEAWITSDAQPGELTTRSVAMFNAPSQNNQRTPLALTSALLSIIPVNKQAHKPAEAPKFSSFNPELNSADKLALQSVINNLRGLKDLQLEVAGHTDNVPIARRSRHIFEDNNELSMARARSTANFIIQELQLQPHQVSITGYGSGKPLARNNSSDSRAKNRRVEVNILAGTNGMNIVQADSGNQMIATTGIAPGGFDFPIEATASGPISTVITMPVFDKAYLAQTDNSFEWLWPSGEYLPNMPSTKLALKHPLDHKIQLTLNGAPVSQLNFTKRETYSATKAAISLWSGVDIIEGNNHFVASLVDSNDNIVAREEFDLHYAGSPTRVILIEDETRATADGVVAPVIAVKLFDKDGYPVRDGLQGEFTVDSPYYALNPNKDQVQINRNEFKPNFEINNDGIAYITLEPTTQAGEAVIRFPFSNDEIRVWLKPQNREWMLIALGEGTIGYQDISGHVNNAKSHDLKDEFYTDGRLALFAKGQILGDWLLTAAYDSTKGKTTPFEKLLDPNKYYTLYGDNSQQKLDASMEGKLYVRIEKERFYTVFGDYSTDLSKTELSKYLRKFHGIQSVFQGDVVSFNMFATESAQRFVRDEIQGDGTSGLYQLSEKNIISNSETISIQVRDRFRSEVILQETELAKDSDYSIDYIDGSLFFKTPIHSTDEALNPRYIIVRYETKDDNANDITFGGRVALHSGDKNLEVGTTVITEELGNTSRTLNGVDMRFKLNEALEIKAERAFTEHDTDGVKTSSNASIISLDFRGEQLQAKAYARSEEAGFGLDQLNDSEGNTEKLGVEGTLYFTSAEYINALFSDQNTLGSSQRQTMLEAKYNQEYDLGRYHMGTRISQTQSALGDSDSIQQILAGHSFTLFNGSLLLNTDAEFNLQQNDDIYDLVRVGSDYRINEHVMLFAVYEAGLSSDAPQRSVLGLRATPWQGMQLSSSVEQQDNKDGTRLFAVHGLNQDINLDEHWQVSFGFDQAQDLENTVLEQSAVVASSDDFYAFSTGLGYRSPQWQWTNRLEYRESDTGHKWNALTGVFHPVAQGFAIGVNAEYRADEQDTSSTDFKQIEFDIGLRPLTYGLAWLNQSKYIEENQTSTDSDLVSRRLLNNTHVNMRWNKTQLSAQYGLKYVDENFDGTQYSGIIDLIGMQLRHHITPKWDWGVHLQRLYDYELKDSRHSLGASIGLTPQANTWVSFGYNFAGFSDSDFDGAGYNAHGIYMKIRIKADQDNLANLRNYFQ